MVPFLDRIGPWAAGRYRAAILDLWGVVHDGEKPTPHALDALVQMRASGVRTMLLSNAPRTVESVKKQIAGFGIPPGSYDDVVSSGGLTREALAARADPWHAKLGHRFYHLGPERDWGLLDGLDYELAPTPERAHFILNTGLFDDETETAADYTELLQLGLRKHLPMICANPDRWVYRGTKRLPCAGEVARAYVEMGGDVRYHGKPYPSAYAACMARAGGVTRAQVLAVGDSLTTDIAGANAAGIDSVLILSGLHADEFGGFAKLAWNSSAMAALGQRHNARPSAAMLHFAW